MLNQAGIRFEQNDRVQYEAIPFERCVGGAGKVFAWLDFDNMVCVTEASEASRLWFTAE